MLINRKTCRSLIRLASLIPGVYPLLAFLAARRVLVRGWSMHPALRPGERVLFDRLAYLRRSPRPGEVVLAAHPARLGLRMIKRVACAPGDTVVTAGGPQILALGDYWLLGDAEDMSTDSREVGPFRREDIVGRAWLVYWPPERFRLLR